MSSTFEGSSSSGAMMESPPHVQQDAPLAVHQSSDHPETSGKNTKKGSSSVVTPAAAAAVLQQQQQAVADASLEKRMNVDKHIVDELLLVCGVIGTTTSTTTDNNVQEELVPVTDCLNWLQDLQRALRRDDDLYRPISLLLGQWKIVQQKLLPLVVHSRYDTNMVLTVCKILVILTKPLSENTIRAGRMVIDTKSKNANPAIIEEQKKLRENALQQAETLCGYKRIFCYHPSHHRTKKKDKDGEEGGLLSIFVSLLAEPLSRTGNARTDIDHLTIELVLHLFRNLLAAEPLVKTSKAEQLHYELITLFERELVLEILLVLAADIEQRENVHYNLLLMELLQYLFKYHDPTIVAQQSLSQQNNKPVAVANNTKKRGKENSKNKKKPPPAAGSLLGQLQREKQTMAASATSRHSQFGGTIVISKSGGRRKQFVSAAMLGKDNTQQSNLPARRKNKNAEPFIGANRRPSTQRQNTIVASGGGPAATRAAQTIHKFCTRFVESCYGPVMKSLKNEFRRDSVRLEDGDRVIFFQLAWFVCQWWRTATGGGTTKLLTTTENNNNDDANKSSIGQLIFTMDVFTFRLVLNATDTFTEHKKYASLAHSVAFLSEMMHLLYIMYNSKESTEQIMALGLMDRLFYGSEPLDRLPKLLSKWTPGTSTREYLCDLVEVCHMTLKLLEANAKPTASSIGDKLSDESTAKHDTVAKMKATASDFDVPSYFARKIVSNHTVFMYTHLLSQYAVNSTNVNHRVVALFTRLRKHKIALGASENGEASDEDMRNPLALKTVTFEPMLYNVQMLTVLNSILNDSGIRGDKEFDLVLQFASKIIHNFAAATKDNPMLFVEALFKHPLPHRFCESAMNMYISEDLRMMAERDLLLKQQRKLEQESAALANDADDDEESEDEELEFTDVPMESTIAKPASKKSDTANNDGDGLMDSDDEASANAGATGAPRSSKAPEGSDDESDDDEVGQRLTQMAEKSARQTQELKKRLRALAEDSNSSDDDDGEDLGKSTSSKPEDAPEAKKARTSSGLSDSEDDN